jgi:hypothetical protein
MDGIDNPNIFAPGKARQRGADTVESGPKTLPAMRGNQNGLFARIHYRTARRNQLTAVQLIADMQYSIDPRIAGNQDRTGGNSFPAQVCRGPFGSGEVHRRHPRSQYAVHLLGKRLPHVSAAQAGLDVSNRHVGVECGQRATESSGGVSLNDSNVRADGSENSFQSRQNPGGGLKKCLAGQHQVQIVVRLDAENLKDLVKHPAVLSGNADNGAELRRP